ncbi:MAG: Ribonuclease [Variovorax sp.]|nr:Ribonuclease [Variovorax sp.]
MKFAPWFDVCKKTVKAWSDDFAPSMGAAISYYTMFSLAPLLVLVIAIAGLVFGAEAVQGQIATQLSGLMGEDTAQAVQGMVESASVSNNGLWASVLSVIVLIVGATSVFGELQSALDRIWHVPEAEKPSGVWGILRARVFSFGLILGLAFLLMVSLSVSAGLAAFGGFIGGLLPGEEALLHTINLVVSLAVTTVLFAMIFKLMPTAKVEWRDVWIGSAVTAVLFEIGKFLIGLYLGKSGMADSFAGAGSLVILLAWVYYAAQIFLLGAEFTKVYARAHGSARDEQVSETSPGSENVLPAATALPGLSKGNEATTTVAVGDIAARQAALDQRVSQAAAKLLPRMLLLGTMAALRIFAERRLRAEGKRMRAARRRSR